MADSPDPVMVPAHIARFVVGLLADRERLLDRDGITPHRDQVRVRTFLAAACELPRGDRAEAAVGDSGPREWISTAEAARIIGVTSRSVRRYVDRGWIGGRRVGRDVLVDRGDAESFADGGR